MTEPAPLPPDVVDELLSAELDGEFDAAAADHGLTAAQARDRLAATPGVEARRAAIAAARSAIAVEPLDDSARARMIASALDAQPTDELSGRRARRGSQRFVLALGAAAAAVLVVVGLAVFVTSNDDDTAGTDVAVQREADDESAGEAFTSERDAAGGAGAAEDMAAPTAEAAPLVSASYGAVDDLDALRERVARDLGLTGAPPVARSDGDAETPQSLPATGSDAHTCLEELVTGSGYPFPPLLQASATYAGRPVEVVVVGGDDVFLVWVVDTEACTTVASTEVTAEP